MELQFPPETNVSIILNSRLNVSTLNVDGIYRMMNFTYGKESDMLMPPQFIPSYTLLYNSTSNVATVDLTTVSGLPVFIDFCYSVHAHFFPFDRTGYGANLSFRVHWELLASGPTPGEGVNSSGIVTSASSHLISYPPPSLTPSTLRLNETEMAILAPDQKNSFVIVPSVDSTAWLYFEGQFGDFPDQVLVTYSLNEFSYECTTSADPALANGLAGEITRDHVRCRTATGEKPGQYLFTVDVAGQSVTGVDELIIPVTPELLSVSGCNDDGNGTYDCPTAGGLLLTLTGTNFSYNMVSSQLMEEMHADLSSSDQ